MFSSKPSNEAKPLIYSFIARSIFTPTKIRITPRPYFRYLNSCATAARAKYKARRPSIAKMLLVRTINGSRLTEKTAGIESTANATSVVSITSKVINNGVATQAPLSPLMKNFSPCILSVTGNTFLNQRTMMLFEGSAACSSSWLNIFPPV